MQARSGRSMLQTMLVCLALTGCGGGGGQPSPPASPGPVVTVSAQASEPFGNSLSYDWRVTDGAITAQAGPTITWQLPAGPGLHFAYVLVANGKGGYTERRIAVSTDTIGTAPGNSTRQDFDPPASPAPTGRYSSFIRTDQTNYYCNKPSPTDTDCEAAYLPDKYVYLQSSSTGTVSSIAKTDLRGRFSINGLGTGFYDVYVASSATGAYALMYNIEIQESSQNYPYGIPSTDNSDWIGRAVLADGSPCGMVNDFFGKKSTATAILLNTSGTILDGPISADKYGHWGFSNKTGAAKVRVTCENANPVTLTLPAPGVYPSPRTTFTDSTSPVISSMSATLNGQNVGLFLPPPSGLPSDKVSDPEFFLTAKGIDTRLGACRYYQAIGVVQGCDAQGGFVRPIRFDDWKRKVRMDPYAQAGYKDTVATYINQVDLNLTRNHHAITYGPDWTAAYVCNHLGPKDGSQAAADAAISNATQGKNLVACVAMDYRRNAGVNGGQPFVRFMIFGPSGELLPSINLDGRREKFMPGVCVACHGGDHYAGSYPEDGTGPADFGGHFLPYDVGNFVFSTTPALTKTSQRAAIYQLNQIALQTNATTATRELVQGWYAKSLLTFDEAYTPISWINSSPASLDFYHKVYAKNCRTCHVAFSERYNFDHKINTDNNTSLFKIDVTSCGGASQSFARNFSMPNSLVTMNLFWNSSDGPAANSVFLTEKLVSPSTCALSAYPLP